MSALHARETRWHDRLWRLWHFKGALGFPWKQPRELLRNLHDTGPLFSTGVKAHGDQRQALTPNVMSFGVARNDFATQPRKQPRVQDYQRRLQIVHVSHDCFGNVEALGTALELREMRLGAAPRPVQDAERRPPVFVAVVRNWDSEQGAYVLTTDEVDETAS